ncbi:MAG: hypothetical protein R3C14_51630 [Caldilineaceae bacterium]
MSITDSQSDEYQSYLLRLWRAERDGRYIWFASLESVQSRECYKFTSLQALFTFFVERLPVGPCCEKEDAPHN